MSRLIVLNPTSGPRPSEILGERLESLAGKTVGFFSNNKPNAEVLLKRVAGALRERFCVETLHFSKEVPSLEAAPELIRKCGEACHAVVLAAYD